MLEAYPDYWRKVPNVQRLVFKSVPEATTRLAMVKHGEADIAYGLFGPLAEEVRRDPKLKLEAVLGGATHWVSFVDQYDPQSPWADTRVRLAANHAVNWPAINDAEMLGYAVLTGGIIPRRFAFTLPLEPYGYDPKQASNCSKRPVIPEALTPANAARIRPMQRSSKPSSMISLRWASGPRRVPWSARLYRRRNETRP